MMKGINISMPFIDAIKEIPTYGKFLKELISNKNAMQPSTVNLSKECSAILMNEVPQKLEDPGSFSIPCTIGTVHIERALCDLGESISLMTLKIFKKLKDYELLPTRVSLKLADRSVRYPIGLVEDVPLKVGKLEFPYDFYVMDILEDSNIPIILGRSCLATRGATIDVKNGKLSLQVGEEKVELSLNKAMKEPSEVKSCYMIDMVEEWVDMKRFEEDKGLQGFLEGKDVIGYSIDDIKGISPSFCTHRIHLEDEGAYSIEPQRRLNPTMKEVVRKEVLKLYDASTIYPISDSAWVSPVHVVPKKAGVTVVTNDKNELIPTRITTGWRMLKEALITVPIMQPPTWGEPFGDASDVAVGAVLGQRKNGKLHAIYYASKTLDEAQANYTTTEKELLAVIYAMNKFCSYLVGSKIRDKKGVENVVVDHLSRLVNGNVKDGLPIDDYLPDDQLFALAIMDAP
ncbi:uncharacterized protein LOC141655240 [Silene latifolia]|uniref:uncharacterized protein LOC141655240 n=1 Tax=Silene latifolia TaxID=37657 RepID=UPI003D77514D